MSLIPGSACKKVWFKVESNIYLSILSLDNPKTSNEGSWSISTIFGILDGSFILYELFARDLCQNEWQYTKIKGLLLEYSMIKCNQHVSKLDGHIIEYLTIHLLYYKLLFTFWIVNKWLYKPFNYVWEKWVLRWTQIMNIFSLFTYKKTYSTKPYHRGFRKKSRNDEQIYFFLIRIKRKVLDIFLMEL